MTDVLIVVPAHDEAELIGAALRSVSVAVTAARTAGVVDRARIAVGLHRCRDDTEGQARAALNGNGLDHVLVVEPDPMTVGRLRTRVAAAAGSDFTDAAWLFSTDADTVVPPDWITGSLTQAARYGSDLILGLADLDDWTAEGGAQAAYAELIAGGLTEQGHVHAYAANLAVRLGAFRQVGGFPAVAHGEEHGLAAACRAAGLTVTSTLHPRVRTSARMPGRAGHGLGSLLSRLAQADPA